MPVLHNISLEESTCLIPLTRNSTKISSKQQKFPPSFASPNTSSDLQNTISWEIPFKWQITLTKSINQTTCNIISVITGISKTSILNISNEFFHSIKNQKFSYLSRLLIINESDMTLSLNKGLQGGGAGCCNQRFIEVEKIYAEIYGKNSQVNRILHEQERLAYDFASKIANSMKSQSIDKDSLNSLFQINPQNLLSPLGLFNILISEANKYAIWNSPIYYDERRQLTYLLRLYFSISLLRNLKTKNEIGTEILPNIIDDLEKIKKYMQKEDYEVPESSTLLNISLLFDMIIDNKLIFSKLLNNLQYFKQIAYLILCHNDVIPPDYFNIFLKNYKILNTWIGSKTYGCRLLWDIIEAHIRVQSNFNDQLKDFIQQEVTQETSWEKKLCMIDTMERIVTFNPTNDDICSFLTQVLKQLLNQNNDCQNSWKIRERIVLFVRSVINLTSFKVSEDLNCLKNFILENEKNERVRKIFLLPEIKNLKNSGFLDGLEEDLNGIFVRDVYLQEIKNLMLQSARVIVVSGLTGMGRRSLCVRFAIQHKNSFDFILKLNCESSDSLKSSLKQYASKLSITYQTDQDLQDSAKAIFQSSSDRVLIIFDKFKSLNTIKDFLDTGVKSLIISNKRVENSINLNKFTKKLEIQKLEDQQSVELLKSLSVCEIKDKNFEKLVKICAGWPIAIQIVSAELRIHQDISNYIDSLEDVIITEDNIKYRIESLVSEIKIEAKIILGFAKYCAFFPIPIQMIKQVFGQLPVNYTWWNGISDLKNYFIANVEDGYIKIQDHIHKSLASIIKISELKQIGNAPELLLKYLNEFGRLESEEITNERNLFVVHAEAVVANSKVLSVNRIEVIFKLCRIYKGLEEVEKIQGFLSELEEFDNEEVFTNNEKKCEYLVKLGLFYSELNFFSLETKIDRLVRPNAFVQYKDLNISLKLLHSDKLAALSTENKNFKFAINYHLRSLEYKKEIFGNDSEKLVEVYTKLVDLYENLKEFNKCKEFCLSILENININGNVHEVNISLVYLSLANCSFYLYDNALSKEYYLKYFETLPEQCSQYFKACWNLGQIYHQEKAFKASYEYFDQARVYFEREQPNNRENFELNYLKLGECCENLDDIENAEKFYNEYLKTQNDSDLFRKIVEKIGVMYEKQAFNNKIRQKDSTHEYKKKSAEYYMLLISDIEKKSKDNVSELVYYIEKIIQIFSDIQEFDRVKVFRIKLVDLLRPITSKEEFIEKLKVTGKFCKKVKDYEKAYEMLDEALCIQEKISGLKNKNNLEILKKIAEICVNREKIHLEINQIYRYLNIYDANMLYNTPEIAKFMGCLADCLSRDNKPMEAKMQYQKAIAILRKLGLSSHNLFQEYSTKLKSLS